MKTVCKSGDPLEQDWPEVSFIEGEVTVFCNAAQWEKGINEPNIETILRIANCFHVSPYTLMPFDEKKTDEDSQQEILDTFSRSPKRKMLFDRTRHFSDKDLDALLAVCDAIASRGDADE